MADCAGVIAQLFIYPIKSCGGIEITQAELTATGLSMDREWMIVDQGGMFLTQRQIPHMVWITPTLTTTALTLSAPGVAPVSIALELPSSPKTVTVWRDTLLGDDQGDEVAQWLDSYLAVPGKNHRLIRFSKKARRLSALDWTKGVEAVNKFSDGFAVQVVTQSALDELNTRLSTQGHEAVSMSRFRPNIVLEQLEAHTEDHLGDLTIHTAQGQAQLHLVKPCPRCAIPDINPDTAISSPEVNDTLRGYRTLARVDGAICFGMNGIVHAGVGHTLAVGQRAEGNFAFD
ncbi:MAG: MOSC domain-containing protein [Zwartia sp.]